MLRIHSGVVAFALNGATCGIKCEGHKDKHEDNEDKSELVLASIACEPSLTARQLAAKLPISKATVERVLKTLRSKGKLRRVGGTCGHWEILK